MNLEHEHAEFRRTWSGLPLLFSKVWGSWSHNCGTPSSDLDFLAVYVAPTREILGLNHVQEDVERKVADGSPFDLEAHEIGKFCRLLLKGGPAMIECLFTDRLFVAEPAFATLMENRRRFLCGRSIKQYLGYAEGQIKRFFGNRSLHSKGGEATEKWAYHFARLAIDAERISRGEAPVVWKEGPELAYLMQIRSGEVKADDVVRRAEQRIAEIREREMSWDVPPEPDTAWLSEWLVSLRSSLLKESP